MNDNKTVKERYEAEPKTFALIYLDIIKERNRWRGITAFLAATSLLLTIGIVYAAFSVKYIPYIVSVSDSGEFKGVGVLNEIKYEPKEGEIKYFLKVPRTSQKHENHANQYYNPLHIKSPSHS